MTVHCLLPTFKNTPGKNTVAYFAIASEEEEEKESFIPG
jgi:hypothetical protein